MNPYNNRAFLVVESRSPHVKVEAVFTHVEIVPAIEESCNVVRIFHYRLRSACAIEDSVLDSFPWLRWLGWFETVFTGSAGAIRNTKESIGVAHNVTPYLTILSVSNSDVVANVELLICTTEEIFVVPFIVVAARGCGYKNQE